MTQQIVINVKHGGFGLSERGHQLYEQLAGKRLPNFTWEIQRNDPHLVQVVLQLGSAANDKYASLKVVTIPGDVEWHIEEYDGQEWIAENHRTWK